MSTNENPVDSTDLDLDSFSDELFGRTPSTPEPASSEEPSVDEDVDTDAPTDDTQPEETDTLENEDELEQEEEEAPKPKKTRFQERIDKLTGEAREAQRERDELRARLEKLEKGSPEPVPAAKKEPGTAPSPTDKNDDGTDKYPLGDFDANYIRDLTKHTLQQERAAIEKAETEKRQLAERESQATALASNWNEKLEPAKERYPDFQEKGEQLIDSFEGIPPAYGEYLTGTLMAMDYGPDVLYYLANNVDEAKKIIAMGAQKATIALGRIEAKFALAEAEKQTARLKVSNAPEPPQHQNKGSAVSRVEVPDDTDDLDAFEKKLFKKRR